MTTVVPVDQFVTDEWYPGFTTAFDDTPWLVEPFRTFAKEDESRFWFLDFHWPRGLTPMGLTWNQDGYAWGTQLAAETLPLPPGRGISVRLAGTHTYAASIPVTDPAHVRERAKRMGQTLPAFLGEFDAIWTGRVAEIERSWSELRRVELEGLSPAELGAFLRRARAFHKRAFEIHFEVMYPLLVNYVAFFGLCIDLGVDPLEIAKFLQGYDTKILETDRELWRLTREARSAGLSSLFAATEPEQLAATLSAAGGRASGWLSTFDAFLDTYGWRTEGTSDIALPSWIEDPTPALGVIKTFLTKEREHDFAAARAAAIEERESAIDAARSSLTREEQTVFDAGLASCQAANFVWWQDEHNFVIDLRVALPMRWACLALGRQVGADRPDDTLFLFWPEIMAVTDGERRYDDYRGLVEARRQYFDHWHDRRPSMPKVLGTVPDAVQDPHRDLRSESALPARRPDRDIGRSGSDLDRHRGSAGRRSRDRPGALRRRPVAPHPTRRGPRLRVHVPELDARLREDRGLCLRQRRHAVARRDRRPRVRRSDGDRCRARHRPHQERRRGRGGRDPRHRHRVRLSRYGGGDMTGYVVWLDAADPQTVALVAGSKLGRLAELHRIGVTVPRGFAVTVDAYRHHLAAISDGAAVEEAASKEIRAALAETPIADEIRDAVVVAYRELSARCAESEVSVAVRSSATGEDSSGSSFAGVFDTYLGMTGADQVLDAVRRCWGSLFAARALSYRLERGATHADLAMGVGVLELVPAHAAGVAFSVHPVTGRSDRIVIEASYGWGEAVAQGLVTPDRVEVAKADARILRYDVATKTVVSTFDPRLGRVVERDMPVEMRDRRVLDDEQIAAVAREVAVIERHHGHPVDVEWVLDRRRRHGEPICIVQARPVTVVEPVSAAPMAWDPVDAFMRYTVGDARWRE
jgi:hypothetical protein